jgi:hypothetical protein
MARDGNPVLHVDTSSPLRIRAFVAHPIAAFLTMVFSIAYPVMTLPILAIHGVIPGAALLQRLPVEPDAPPARTSSTTVAWPINCCSGVRPLCVVEPRRPPAVWR